MQAYTELAPPTAVTHAVHLPFLSPKSHNLVVAKTSLLQIFDVKSTVTEVANFTDETHNGAPNLDLDTEAADVPLQRTEHTSKLVLVAEFPLAGTVLSLARIKLPDTKFKGEALLIAFRDAKMSLVEWDPETCSLETISIHYYEGPDLAGAPWCMNIKETHNFLTADPTSRCAILKFGQHNLAILPFRQPGMQEDDYDSEREEGGGHDIQMKEAEGVNGAEKTPYLPSFVLPLTHLDPMLTHPVHLAFLHEYREPTFGIVAASKDPTPSLLAERKDILTYTVFTLDLEQKASTTLLSVPDLPYDISRVVPLPSPIGGALLIGANEIIHVDQAGKSNGVAVNEFAKISSSFPLSDQADLRLRLEGCAVEILSQESGDVLLVLDDGRLVTLTFSMDGRTVSGITVQPVAPEKGGAVLSAQASCATNLGRGRVFIGSEDGDSVLLGWTSSAGEQGRQLSQGDENSSNDSDEDMDDDMDDDLYNDTAPTVKKVTAAAAEPTAQGSYTFRIHDILPSIAGIKDVLVNSAFDVRRLETQTPASIKDDILLAHGRGRAGAITSLNKDLTPHHLAISKTGMERARGLWAVHATKAAPTGVKADFGQDEEANMASDVDYDQYLVVCQADAEGTEETVVYEVKGNEIEVSVKGDLERGASTINVGTLAGGEKIVQVLRTEARTYDSEMNLEEIIQMEDESGEEIRAISASFADPYLLILREDSTVKLWKYTDSGELEEVERDEILSPKWLTASLYHSTLDKDIFVFLLAPEGGLHIFNLSNLEQPAYVADGLGFLPPVLTTDTANRRSTGKAAITEILAADLGDETSKSAHLILRTNTDDLVIYRAFHYPNRLTSGPWTTNLRWQKLPQQHLPKYNEEPAANAEDAGRESTLMALSNIAGYSTVFQRGASPCFIFKEASSAPRVISLTGKAVKGLTRFHTSDCERGFAYIDSSDTFRISQLPSDTHFGHLGWAAKKRSMGSEIAAMTYHPRDVCVIGTGETEQFEYPQDTYHYPWEKDEATFLPHVERGVLNVYDAKTWNLIDTHVLEPQEVILTVKTLNLEVSEVTHERKALIAVGTALVKGEDLATKGNIRIFEVITVVPDPSRPETNRKLRLILKDEVKGAVSAISELGSQGFLIMAQGQKCMVRGLKEDETLLPVAFMDMQCYVTVLKGLPGTGFCLMGDAAKGAWFAGYTEEPYRMMLFGRSKNRMEVLAGDFLPFEKSLHFIVADADMNLQVLQYDPENPRSMAGSRLLHKSTLHTGHFPTSMHLLISQLNFPTVDPSFPNGSSTSDPSSTTPSTGPLHQILMTSQSGLISLITPLPEHTYRRLSTLQNYLTHALDHACALNPRAYRAVETETAGLGGGVGRGILDGTVLVRWGELSESRRREGSSKIGGMGGSSMNGSGGGDEGDGEWIFKAEREVLVGRGVWGRRLQGAGEEEGDGVRELLVKQLTSTD